MNLHSRTALFLAVVGSAGCATLYPPPKAVDAKLLRQAAFELNCKEDALEVAHLSMATRGVSGCGRRASYLLKCEDPPLGGGACPRPVWILNGAVQTSAETQPVASSSPPTKVGP
jgi:hypothetical protein